MTAFNLGKKDFPEQRCKSCKLTFTRLYPAQKHCKRPECIKDRRRRYIRNYMRKYNAKESTQL